jgi:predicted transcriptional regulator
MLCIGLLTLFILAISAPAFADTGGYVMRPISHDEAVVAAGGDYKGDDRQVSFLELPLWVQALYASGAIAAIAVAVKVLPFFFVKARRTIANGNRERIYEYIGENPGSTMHDIARGMGMNLGSVRYHVYMLELARKIKVFKSGKFLRYFLNNRCYDEREIEVISALNVRMCKTIVSLLLEHPGLPNHEIARKLGMHQSLVHANLSRLLEGRVIRFEVNGRHKAYYPEGDVGGIFERAFGRQAAKSATI